MGCIVSQQKKGVVSPSTRVVPISSYLPADRATSFKHKILEAIKRKEPILFEKCLHQYQMKVQELNLGSEHKQTIFHAIAEYNFSEGMTLIIEYVNQRDSTRAHQIMNTQDVDGNTPGMVCCRYKAPETLEILLNHDLINLYTKNYEGKTALEIALENFSPCATLLSSVNTSPTKSGTKQFTGSVELGTPRNQTNTSIATKGAKKEIKFPVDGAKDACSPLTTISCLTKDASIKKLSKNTRGFSTLMELKESNYFADQEFPHDVYSIVGHGATSNLSTDPATMKWLRPSDIAKPELKKSLLFETIDLNDVSNSDLAGCDLYSALAVMTEFPQRLLNVFTIKETNKQGVYSVQFLIAGIPVEIVLDDHFPCNANSELVFSSPVANEIWFLILEKAFAKLYGSYEEIKSVQFVEALELMTGMPCVESSLKDTPDQEIWNSMLNYDKKNYMMCVGLNRVDDDKKNKNFMVIGLYETEQYKVIKLRNPFQDYEWSGIFSERSKIWTKDLREELGFIRGEYSTIFMELEELSQHFDSMVVCHYLEGWDRSRVDITSSHKKAVFFELDVKEEADVFISVHQKLPRYVNESPDYSLSPVEILLARKDRDNYFEIATGEREAYLGKQTTFLTDNGQLELAPGKYIVRAKVKWVDEKEHEFTLNAFSQTPVSLKQINEQNCPNFLERLHLTSGVETKERYQLSHNCEFISAWSGPHLWIYGVNYGKKTWTFEITFQTMVNLKLCKKNLADSNVLKLVIPPGQQGTTYAKRISSEMVEVLWNLNHSWE